MGRSGAEDLDIESLLEAVMSNAKMNAIQARLDVLTVALTALARALPAERAAAVQDGLRRAVAQRLDGVTLSPDADAAVAADLGSLMSALGDRASRNPDRATLAE